MTRRVPFDFYLPPQVDNRGEAFINSRPRIYKIDLFIYFNTIIIGSIYDNIKANQIYRGIIRLKKIIKGFYEQAILEKNRK